MGESVYSTRRDFRTILIARKTIRFTLPRSSIISTKWYCNVQHLTRQQCFTKLSRFWEEIHLKLARLIEQLLKSATTTPTTLGFIHNPGRKRENYNTKITFETKFLPFSAFILMYSRKSARLQYALQNEWNEWTKRAKAQIESSCYRMQFGI